MSLGPRGILPRIPTLPDIGIKVVRPHDKREPTPGRPTPSGPPSGPPARSPAGPAAPFDGDRPKPR